MPFYQYTVAICMITYNHSKFITQAIEGVLMQKTNFSYHLYIGEDCSTDNTRQICLEYKKKYPDLITLLLPEKNLGVIKNCEQTLQACEGKYIAFCEGDDYWTDSYKLQKQVDLMESNSEYGLCYTDVDFLYQESGDIRKAVFKNGVIPKTLNFEEHLVKKRFLAPCTWLFRREFVDIFDLEGYTDASFAMLLDVFQNSKVYFLDEVTTVYRVSDGSASRPKDEKKRYYYEKGIFEVQKNYISKYNVDEKISRLVYSDAYFRLMKDAMSFDDQDFVSEGKAFFCELGLSVNSLFSFYNETIKREQKLHVIRTSKLYRMVSFFIKPSFLLKNKLKKNT